MFNQKNNFKGVCSIKWIVYLVNGKYKMINNKNTRIVKIFDDVPEWATDELIYRYYNFMSSK